MTATLTNITKHSATLTNSAKNSSTVSDASLSQKIIANYTIAELATKTLAEIGINTFQTKYLVFSNQTKS